MSGRNVVDAAIVPPSQINPEVGRPLDEIVMKAMHKDSGHRYPTAKEFLAALEQWSPGVSKPMRNGKTLMSEPSKLALGAPSATDEKAARALVRRAFDQKHSGRLSEAADLMEEAFNKSPELRFEHAHAVKLWRCGISM
jgi:hypothetical protein